MSAPTTGPDGPVMMPVRLASPGPMATGVAAAPATVAMLIPARLPSVVGGAVAGIEGGVG